MAATHSCILFHAVFSTKHRKPLIVADIQPRLFEYIGGIIRAEGGIPYAVGGVADHVHLLLRWRTDKAVSDLIRVTKSRSSRWVHRTFEGHSTFAWQSGYSLFSVSKSASASVIRYIESQAKHHHKRSFQEELEELLRLHEVEYDPRYMMD